MELARSMSRGLKLSHCFTSQNIIDMNNAISRASVQESSIGGLKRRECTSNLSPEDFMSFERVHRAIIRMLGFMLFIIRLPTIIISLLSSEWLVNELSRCYSPYIPELAVLIFAIASDIESIITSGNIRYSLFMTYEDTNRLIMTLA